MSPTLTFFGVGNGNCTMLQSDTKTCIFDLNNVACDEDGAGAQTSWDLLSPLLKEDEQGRRVIDVLAISHGDRDHCGGFADFKKAIDDRKLIVGALLHCGYDRRTKEKISELPEDYLKLAEEIDRREGKVAFGDVAIALKAGQKLELTDDITMCVLNPVIDDSDLEGNEHSIACVLELPKQLKVLLPGDTGCETWIDRILPWAKDNKKEAWLNANLVVVSHHGSHGFLGRSRDDVLKADPHPENYVTLDAINAANLVLSACSRFPLNGDESGDQPPHYAAYKWYHKWWRDTHGVDEDDAHAEKHWRHTSDGHVRLELEGDEWKWNDSWAPPAKKGFVHSGGRTSRPRNEYA